MKSDFIYNRLADLFNDSGFNIIRRISVGEYDQGVSQSRRVTNLLPNAKSLILVGFAGKDFWEILQGFLKENPGFRDTREDWIDDYTVLRFMSATNILEDEKVDYRMAFPFGSACLALDFSTLGEVGGVGAKSLMGILINPEYGLWISLRGAIISDLEFAQYDEPLSSFNPCPECSKPCISACPANTVSENGWDYNACMKFRLGDDTCKDNCSSRRACPYGKEHQYSEEQLAHHHKFVLKSVREYWNRT
jgi:epoxyqueuosine reductase QueG